MLRDALRAAPGGFQHSGGWARLGLTLCMASEDRLPLTYSPLSPSQEGMAARILPGGPFHPPDTLRHGTPHVDKCIEA